MLTTILLQAAKSAGGGMEGLIMIVAMIAIFYFLMIRPQNKKQKEIKRQREAMKTGDRVVTAGGIHGRLRDVKDATVTMEVAPGVTLKVVKTSVRVLERGEKLVSIEDDLSYQQVADKEDRELTDNQTVMEYVN